MLPSHLQQGLDFGRQRAVSINLHSISRSLIRANAASLQQSRCFWGWRRGCNNYLSHIDPSFHRFTRFRTLKTRAKLLDKLRRRGRWDWDAASRPFFTAKHIRLASHWNGTGGRAFGRRLPHNEEADDARSKRQDTVDEVAEEDGYELSQREKEWKDQMEWMRKHVERDPYEAVFGKRFEPFWNNPFIPTWMRVELGRSPKNTSATRTDPTEAESAEVKDGNAKESAPQATAAGEAEPESTKKDVESDTNDSPNGQLTNYSYASTSSTEWDSWTNKARRQEWDSITGETRYFEYDPISNRMIRVKSQDASEISEAHGDGKTTSTSKPQVSESPTSATKAVQCRPVNIPVKKFETVRQSISVPTQSTDSEQRSVYFPSLLNTSVTVSTSKTSALTKHPKEENGLDKLTADDVRASVGKGRRSRDVDESNAGTSGKANATATSDVDPGQSSASVQKLFAGKQPLQSSLDRLQSKELPTAPEPDDSAAHEATDFVSQKTVPKDWERQADLLQTDRVRRTRGSTNTEESSLRTGAHPTPNRSPQMRWIDDMDARKAAYEAKKAKEPQTPSSKDVRLAKANAMLEAEVKEQTMRMQAHEHRHAYGPSGKPVFVNQKDGPDSVPAMQPRTESERYRQKIRSLREELDRTFKQSTAQSELQVDRIRDLERELSKAQKALQSNVPSASEKERYASKVRSLREELDRTFMQSSVHAQMQLERIRELEQELKDARSESRNGLKSIEATRAEGDFCANVVKHAKSKQKWYKQPANSSSASKYELEKAEQKARDNALARQVRSIYEQRYGTIDVNHRQMDSNEDEAFHDILWAEPGPQVVEVESNVDLGRALDEYERDQGVYERNDGRLSGAALANQEKEAHEAQALVEAMRADAVELADHQQDPAALTPEGAASASEVKWTEPPVYKVLAYDAGNDILTTATTSSNFTESKTEAPLSIQQALSQLYQPARFVPHFAQLQKEGFQVIYGTKDLLVFRQVQAAPAVAPAFEDHGLFGSSSRQKDVPKPRPAHSNINPIDGTSRLSVQSGDEPNTGRFANPTGFVGDDAIEDDIEYKHYPRVKREERVFSGSRLGQPQSGAERSGRGRSKRRSRAETSQEILDHMKELFGPMRQEFQKGQTWRSRMYMAISVGFWCALVAYLVGTVEERLKRKERKGEKEMERWQEILEGRRGRWE